MDASRIERELASVIAQHKDKFVGTGALNVAMMAEDCLMVIKESQREIARLTAERDAALRRAEAAVKDLFQMQKAIPILSRRCKFCTERSCRDETGLLMVDGGNCRNGDMWQWRGVCAENAEGGPADEAR